MLAVRKPAIAIYVDRSTQHWIVVDPEGNYWTMPSTENAWECREPFEPSEDTDLEPIPGHYKYLLRLPF
jgi:hypothetical protein